MPTKSKASTELVGIDLVKAALLDRDVKLSMAEEDPEVAQRRIIDAIFNADRVEDIWGGGKPINARDVVDRPFKLMAATFHNSDYSEGSPVFCALEVAFNDTGEQAIVVSGSLGVVARVVKLIEFDALPLFVKIRESKTNSDFKVYDLEPAPEAEPFK